MKIYFILGEFPSLSESFVVQQITGLIDLGQDVSIIAFSKPGQAQTQKEVIQYGLLKKTSYAILPKSKWSLRLSGMYWLLSSFLHSPVRAISLIRLFQKAGQFSYTAIYLLRWCLKKKPEILHAHFGPNAIPLMWLKKSGLRTPLVTSFHGYDVTVYVQEHGRDVYREVFEWTDLVTYNSEATRNKLLGLGCAAKKMAKLPMAIRVENIPFKSRYYTPPAKVRLLSVGRLVEMKGRQYAIEAIAKLNSKYAIQYDIVGDGPLHGDLQTLISRLGLEETVTLWGWVSTDQLAEFYENAHLFIHPSITSSDGNQEGQGVVLLEAQAHGLPVIATQHSAFPESLRDNVTGFLVPERDAAALAEKIEYLILNSHLWPEIGKQGRRFAKEHFDAKTLNRELLALYESITKRQ
ncbi:MAG: glycosyltransferase [Planctomycetaceae bacterium]|nr:glycosyltransferase [Planctomycetaceae bacterium]